MVRVPVGVFLLCAACGSGASGPKAAPADPIQAHVTPAALALDAGVPDAAPAPRLACDDGAMTPAPAPEPTWFCAKDGVRNGPFVSLYPDTSVAIRGSYKDGKLDGAWQRLAPNGAILEQGSYVAGLKDGIWKQLGPTGAVLGQYEMKAGTGTEKAWYDEGPLYSERPEKAGVPHGVSKIFAPDGLELVSARYAHGKLDGTHNAGTKSTLRIEEEFGNGVRQGARRIWQFWLFLVDESYDYSGRPHGPITVWRNKKTARFKGEYKHGRRDGVWTWTDRDDNKEREGTYVDGHKEGLWQEWYENKLTFSGTYTTGRPDGTFTYFDRNSNELGKFDIKDGIGTMMTYWGNHKVASKERLYHGTRDGIYQELTFRGKVVVEGHYSGGVRHGTWKEWTFDGVLMVDESWKRGKLDGIFKKFVDGKLAVQASYKDGKPDGAYEELRDGKPAVTGQFADDRKTGTWTEYDPAGNVVLTATYKDGVLEGSWRQLVGGVVLEGTMTAGRRTGQWTRTDRTGSIAKQTY